MPHQSAPEFEQEIMADCLAMQKELAFGYNTAALESSDDTLRSIFINILTQEHQLHSAVGAAMDKRGWKIATTDLTKEARESETPSRQSQPQQH